MCREYAVQQPPGVLVTGESVQRRSGTRRAAEGRVDGGAVGVGQRRCWAQRGDRSVHPVEPEGPARAAVEVRYQWPRAAKSSSTTRREAGCCTPLKVIFGPAGRPLPQLPITVDDEGFLIARSDFTEPVGPTYWERG